MGGGGKTSNRGVHADQVQWAEEKGDGGRPPEAAAGRVPDVVAGHLASKTTRSPRNEGHEKDDFTFAPSRQSSQIQK